MATEEERAHWISVGRQIEREQSQALIEAEFDRKAELLRKEWEHELPVADRRRGALGHVKHVAVCKRRWRLYRSS